MLVDCPECKRKVSDAAIACPSCGFPVKSIASESKIDQVKPRPPANLERSGIVLEEGAIEKKECPECHALNLPDNSVCYCGFSFVKQKAKQIEQELGISQSKEKNSNASGMNFREKAYYFFRSSPTTEELMDRPVLRLCSRCSTMTEHRYEIDGTALCLKCSSSDPGVRYTYTFLGTVIGVFLASAAIFMSRC